MITQARTETETILKKAREEASELSGKQQANVAKEVEPRAKALLAKAHAQAEQIVKDAEAQAAEIQARQQEILEKNFEEKRQELFSRPGQRPREP